MLRVLRPALPFAAMTLSSRALNSSLARMGSRIGLPCHKQSHMTYAGQWARYQALQMPRP